MGLYSSKHAGRDFNEVRHINKTHVELGKKVVVTKEGGFRLFDYIEVNEGPTIVDYGNGTTRTILPRPKSSGIFTDFELGVEIAIAAFVFIILVWAGLKVAKMCIRYRNYKRYHDLSIGDESRERRKANKSLVIVGPKPKTFARSYGRNISAPEDADSGQRAGRRRVKGRSGQEKRPRSIDSLIIAKDEKKESKRHRRSSGEV